MGPHFLRTALFAICIAFTFSVPAVGQSRIVGTVVDEETGEPLSGANVFLENTLYGTATDQSGSFELAGMEEGTYTLIVSMVGYAREEMSVTVPSSSPDSDSIRSYEVKLSPDPVELNGITVEGDRSTWLERLEEFRESFFGKPQNAGECEFINPEVLAFKVKGDTLVAWAKRPLRVRNKALGYEVTYYLPRYEVVSGTWTRYGTAEFDTMRTENKKTRADWKKARRKTYRGSLYHFFDALQANALEEEGFRVAEVSPHQVRRDKIQVRTLRGQFVSDADEIFTPLEGKPGEAILSTPTPNDGKNALLVQYSESGNFPSSRKSTAARSPSSARGSVPSPQMSIIRFVGESWTFVDTQIARSTQMEGGYFVLHGFWGWYMTAATALPASYRPSKQ